MSRQNKAAREDKLLTEKRKRNKERLDVLIADRELREIQQGSYSLKGVHLTNNFR